jgi:hypothetical protein
MAPTTPSHQRRPWNKGKRGLQQGWSKGLTAKTDPRVAKIAAHMMTDEYREKRLASLKRNKSSVHSKEENIIAEFLWAKYPDMVRWYSDERYKYECDFYVPQKDLFLDLNFHWSHGGSRFDPDSQQCLDQLAKWQAQNFKHSIYIWTVLDPKKRECKVNRLEFFTVSQFAKWFVGGKI